MPGADTWNDRWRTADGAPRAPKDILIDHRDVLPRSGRAIDVAGGLGDDAIWLAYHGLQTTLLDVSDVAVERAIDRATEQGATIDGLVLDLENVPEPRLPGDPWDVVHIANYLNRPLLGELHQSVAPGGIVLLTIATTTNLERNEHPREQFLVEPGELGDLLTGFNLSSATEDWRANNRHEAHVVACKPQ